MGAKNSKEEKNSKLKKIGEDANKNEPSTFCTFSPINVTNELLVDKSKSNPDKDYKKLSLLGEGSFGSVYSVQNKYTDQVYAMKIINKSRSFTQTDESEILNEINILRTMDHPGVMKIFEIYSDPQSYSLITELCPGGELFQQIINKGPFDETYTAYVMYQIFSAINYCHKMNIVHRDLKPENILIVNKDDDEYPTIKICDFGTSRIFEKGTVQRKLVGSSYYIAPEVLKKHYNEKCDVWSCGVIMYILLSGRPPFGGENDEDIMRRVAKGAYDLETPPFDRLTSSALDLIKKLLTVDIKQRLSAEQALNHPWFKLNKSQDLFNKIKDNHIIRDLIDNLKNYKRTSIIQETALAYLVHHFPQTKDVINACKLFNQIDKSGDGKITKAELLKGLSERYKSKTLRSDVDEIYKNLDMDNNGYIGYEEFVRAAVNKQYFTRDNVLKFAFRYFDKDNSGEITFDEVEKLFAQNISNKNKVHEVLKNIIKEVDINNDNKINFEEFSIVMKKMIK